MDVVGLVVGKPYRVRAVIEHIDIASAVAAVLGINRDHRHEFEDLLLDTSRIVVPGPAGDGDILSDTKLVVEEMIVAGESGVETLVVRVAAHTVMIHIIDGERRTAVLESTGQGEVVVLHQGSRIYFLSPVGVGHSHRLVTALVGLGDDRSAAVAKQLRVRIVAVVAVLIGLPVAVSPLSGVQKVDSGGEGLGSLAHVEVHTDLSLLGLLCRDDDDTVCSLGSIDCSRRSILENLDGFDVGGRHYRSHIVAGRHSVDHIQRTGVVDGSGTADESGGVSATGSSVSGYIDTGHPSLQGLHDIACRDVGDLLHLDDSDRTGEVSLLLGHVTCHHDFLKETYIIFKNYVHPFGSLESDGLHADRRELEHRTGRNLDFELAVDVGNGTQVGTECKDCSTDHGFAVSLVDDSAACNQVLCRSHESAEDKRGST